MHEQSLVKFQGFFPDSTENNKKLWSIKHIEHSDIWWLVEIIVAGQYQS